MPEWRQTCKMTGLSVTLLASLVTVRTARRASSRQGPRICAARNRYANSGGHRARTIPASGTKAR